MASFSPIPAYLFGSLFIALGTVAIISPQKDYEIFGLPSPPKISNHGNDASAIPPTSSPLLKKSSGSPDTVGDALVSPYVYAKGIRDVTYGLTYVLLQAQGQEVAITLFSGVVCVAAIGDGLIVWFCGGENLKSKAWGHWGSLAPLLGWIGWRVFSL